MCVCHISVAAVFLIFIISVHLLQISLPAPAQQIKAAPSDALSIAIDHTTFNRLFPSSASIVPYLEIFSHWTSDSPIMDYSLLHDNAIPDQEANEVFSPARNSKKKP